MKGNRSEAGINRVIITREMETNWLTDIHFTVKIHTFRRLTIEISRNILTALRHISSANITTSIQ